MNKNQLIQIKRRLLALSLAGVMLGTAGCTSSKNENGEPSRMTISKEYSNIEDYYKYVMQNGEPVKQYSSENVFLLYDRETYEVKEYIYKNKVTWFGGAELYDLVTEEMLAYGDGLVTSYNEDFVKYLIENNYQVWLKDVSDYVEGHTSKEYYSLDEIRKFEPQVGESLRLINKVKVKTK